MNSQIKELETRYLREFVTETDYQIAANGETWTLVLHRYSDELLTIEHVDIKNKHTGQWLDLRSETARQVIAIFQEFTGKEPANA